jgi:hypothetical protein
MVAASTGFTRGYSNSSPSDLLKEFGGYYIELTLIRELRTGAE